ncbi:polysaccharide pyruvyl transferase family protein [Paenibacillus gansuensis]|uniref:Polysaccharide pyruvyl transferase family protein n=1 Tax=Paenibacillus gansuensis TaxID=306542 RepID=A0ABW5P9G2_9BACL
MKITIMNAYTWFNKGDAGILMGHLNEINAVVENPEIHILSFTPEVDYDRYSKLQNVKSVKSNLLNPYPFKKTKMGKLIAISKLAVISALQMILFFLFRGLFVNANKSMKTLKESDLIIVCGGGFLGGNKFNSLIHLHQIFLATFLGRKVVLWGTSVEPPTNKLIKKITETVLGRLDFVYPREDVTVKYFQTFLPKDKFAFTPDLAFMVPKKNSPLVDDIYARLPQDKTLIGLTVRKWHFPKSADKEAAAAKYKESVVTLIRRISQEKNAVFVFIPQVIFDGDDDRIIANEIKNMLPEKVKDSFIILTEDLSPMEIKELISRFYIFVGTRMHSNIFATGAEVPTVAIAYEKKTNGIMQMLELNNYVVNIEDITPTNIVEMVHHCLRSRERLHEHLGRKIPQVQQLIRSKSAFLGEITNEHHHLVAQRANQLST